MICSSIRNHPFLQQRSGCPRSGKIPQAAAGAGAAAAGALGLVSIAFRLSTKFFLVPFGRSAAPSVLAWLSTMPDRVAKGAADLPAAISATGLPSLAAWA